MIPSLSWLSLNVEAPFDWVANEGMGELLQSILASVDGGADPCETIQSACRSDRRFAALCAQQSTFDLINQRLGWYGAYANHASLQAAIRAYVQPDELLRIDKLSYLWLFHSRFDDVEPKQYFENMCKLRALPPGHPDGLWDMGYREWALNSLRDYPMNRIFYENVPGSHFFEGTGLEEDFEFLWYERLPLDDDGTQRARFVRYTHKSMQETNPPPFIDGSIVTIAGDTGYERLVLRQYRPGQPEEVVIEYEGLKGQERMVKSTRGPGQPNEVVLLYDGPKGEERVVRMTSFPGQPTEVVVLYEGPKNQERAVKKIIRPGQPEEVVLLYEGPKNKERVVKKIIRPGQPTEEVHLYNVPPGQGAQA